MIQSFTPSIFSFDFSGMWIPTVSIIEKILRPLIIYFFLIVALRINGKRELSQINTFDFIVLLMLSNVVQNSIIGNDSSITGGIIGAISLLATNYFVAHILYKSKKIENIVEGKSDYLIMNGKLNTNSLNKDLISIKDLEMAAHKQGIESLDKVEKAELDPSGNILFVVKVETKENKPYGEILQRIEKLTIEIESLKMSISKLSNKDKKILK